MVLGSGWLRRSLLAAAATAALGLPLQAMAASITLSNLSSDPEVFLAELAATLDFTVDGNTLTLSVSNDSASRDIVGVYFNAGASVSGLSLTSGANKWKLQDVDDKNDPTDTGVFGVFDYIVWVKGKDANNEKLAPGESAIFVIDIAGAGVFSASDFLSVSSTVESGEVSVFVAAMFGVDNDSPIGAAHAPEPTTGALLGMGLCLLAAHRVRRRTTSRR
jgi:hypothetical protein